MNQEPDDTGTYDEISVAHGTKNPESTLKYEQENQQRTVQTRPGQTSSGPSGPETTSSTAQTTNKYLDSSTDCSTTGDKAYSRHEESNFDSQRTDSASSAGGLTASSETSMTLMSVMGTTTSASETTMSNPVPSCSGWMPGEENRDSTMKNQPEDQQKTVQTRPAQVSSVGSRPQTSCSTGHTTNPCKKSCTSSSESGNRTSFKQQETHIESQRTASVSGSGGLTASSETSMTVMSIMGTKTSASETTMSNPVPSCSGWMPVHPVGGSVSTHTEHSIQKISGDKVLDLSHAMIKRGTESDYNMSMETVTQEVTGDKQVHFNISKIDIHEPIAVSIGGEMNVGPPPSKKRKTENESPPTEIQELKHKTERSYKQWTEGMVTTKAASTIVDDIVKGTSWVTITGCPGEGKTITGYLVLKHLHNRGREVFDIKTPDDYFKVRNTKQSVIMLNDIFGALSYDHDSVKRWQNVLADVLALREHKQDDRQDTQRSKEKKTHELTVILISRLSVLKEASEHMGKYKHLVLKENLVNLTEDEHNLSEMLEIWKYHANKYGITIDNKLVREVCYLDLPHGFAHCCKLFASMYSENSQLDMEHFFLNPLDFLMDSMTSLMKDPQSGPLLREMLKNDGSLDLDSIEDVEKQYQYQSQVQSMQDTYLTLNGRTVEFHHPSVYDCAAFVLCQSSPTLVIDCFRMSFLNERVRLRGLQQPNPDQTHTTLLVDCSVDRLLKRFQQEFNDRNIEEVFLHSSFFDKEFVARFIECVVPSPDMLQHVNGLFNVRNKHSNKSFLFLMTKSGSDEVLRYIHKYAELTEEEQSEALFGVCEHSSLSSLKFLLETYKNINLEVTDSDNQTPLLISTQKRSPNIIKQLLMANVNVNSSDNEGMTPLLNICKHGVEGDDSVVKMLIEKGADPTVTSQNDCDTPLHLACDGGHVKVVTSLLDQGADVNKTNSDGDTSLHLACDGGHVKVVTSLLDQGADVNKTNSDGDTSLHLACAGGHIDTVLEVIDNQAELNTLNRKGESPLHRACYYGHKDVVLQLLNKGADVNVDGIVSYIYDDETDDSDPSEDDYLPPPLICQPFRPPPYCIENETIYDRPLHVAVEQGYIDIVSILLEKGAEVDATDDLYGMPLVFACANGNFEMVKLLLDKGADVDCESWNADSEGSETTPLHEVCFIGHVDIMQLLLDKGAYIEARLHNDNTPLHEACSTTLDDEDRFGKSVDIVSLLLEKGACINVCNDEGLTPLHCACMYGHADVVPLLIDRGADVNKREMDGNTPLPIACFHGHHNAVALILDKGADINTTNRFGNTPLFGASWGGHFDIVLLLLDKGADANTTNRAGETLLHGASQSGNADIVSLFLNKGIYVNTTNNDGATPLERATQSGNVDTVSLLLNKGADVNTTNRFGGTPLYGASEDGHVDIVSLLLNRGADMNKRTITGTTPLHVASEGEHVDIVSLLLDKGADVNTTNSAGDTPLHAVSKSGNVDIVSLLLNKDAYVNTTNSFGSTPLYEASLGGHGDVVSLLLNKGADMNYISQTGATPLNAASKSGNVDNVSIFPNINTTNSAGDTPLGRASQV